MAVKEVIESSSVLLEDIRDTLNANGGSVGNDASTFFTESANINMWAFYKPYAYSDVTTKLTDTQIKGINCGFEVKQIASYTSLPSVMDGGMNGWSYTLPSGGSSSPYRCGDYVGYYAASMPMISNFYIPVQVSLQETSEHVSSSAIVTIVNTLKRSVTLSDLSGLSSCKSALYLVNSRSSATRMFTGTTLSDGIFGVSFPISELTLGEWTVYPFITTGSVHYTIPNVSARTLKVIQSTLVVYGVLATKATDGTKTITWWVNIKNMSGNSVTLNNNYAYLLYNNGERPEDVTMSDGRQRQSLDDGITISDNTTMKAASGTFDNIADEIWENPIIWVQFNSGNYESSGVPLSITDNPAEGMKQ